MKKNKNYSIIRVIKRVLKNKKFSETEKTKELLDKFNRNNNPLFEFIDYLENDSSIPMEFNYIINNYPCTAIFEGYFISTNNKENIVGYKEWANKNGYKPISFNTFKENMCKNFNLDVKRLRKSGKQERYFIKK